MLRSAVADLVSRRPGRRLTAVVAALTLAVTGGGAGAGACGVWPGSGTSPAPARPGSTGTSAARPVDVMFHGLWTRYTDEQRAHVLDRLQAAGVTSVRIDLSWVMLQPDGPESYDRWGTEFVDRVIAMANERSIRPLMMLWLTPGWANGNQGQRTAPYRAEDYARVAGWAADRWRGKVLGWEVWNEPNSDAFLRGADPAAYVRILRAAYPAIKAGDPNAAVVFGGVEYNDVDWLRRAYDAGAKGSFDVLATHPYQGIADLPPTARDSTKWTLTHASEVRRLMVDWGDAAKPIWFTEFGWSAHANWAGIPNWERGVTPEQQGDYFVRALQYTSANYPYVPVAFWYKERTLPGENDVHQAGFGLLDGTLAERPVYTRLKSYLTGS